MPAVKRHAFWLGAGAFALYLYSAGPALVPFRDAGEMTTTTATLGILHPTGYPAYTLLGHLATRLPLGNPGYRLNVLSAVTMAATWSLVSVLFAAFTGSLPATVASVLLGLLSYHFWAHALIAEMYALNLLFLSAVLVSLCYRQWLLAAFLAGAGLSNRADLLLTFPAMLMLGWSRFKDNPDALQPSPLILLAGFLGGLMLYLYLPLRASQHPLLNWNDPSTLENLMRTLLRRGYAGTLDLLSTSYPMGENFLPELRLYTVHLWRDFAYAGLPLALYGSFRAWRRDRWICGALLTGFIVTGPLFIFLGNLPINPHAVAIMESGYLMPDIFFLGFVAFGLGGLVPSPQPSRHDAGLGALQEIAEAPWSPSAGGGSTRFIPLSLLRERVGVRVLAEAPRWLLILILIPLLVWQGWTTLKDVNKRDNYLAVDFARNVYRTLPPEAIVVARSDVPAFSLLYGHWIYPNGAGRWPLAQGLMGSPWYLRMMRDQGSGITVHPLKTASDWDQLSRLNADRLVAATLDIDWPAGAVPPFQSKGAIVFIPNRSAPERWQTFPSEAFFDLYAYRGPYRTTAYRDFFSQELVEAYAKAWMRSGQEALRAGRWTDAQTAYQNAFRYKPDLPYASFELAYAYFMQNRYPEADQAYQTADRQFQQLMEQAAAWKSLPPLPAQIRRDRAQALAQRGVAQERLGNLSQAENLYQQALSFDPDSADGRYNLAVLLWKKGAWPQVVEHFQAMARSHPEDARWKRYLPMAMSHLK
ncbi:MAG: tetratricopeptide repeat protein [Elusimicrobiota bacterium]|jgi:Tfp pilus assembly protein PilF